MHASGAPTRSYPFAQNGARIRSARKRAGLSQERLAEQAGTTRRHLIRLENGEHLPGRDLRNRILSVTGAATPIESADDEEDEPLSRSLSDDLLRLARMAQVLEAHPELLTEVDA